VDFAQWGTGVCRNLTALCQVGCESGHNRT